MPNRMKPTQLSRSVTRLQRLLLDVGSSALEHAAEVAGAVTPVLQAGLPEGATMPDLELFQVILGNVLGNDRQQVEAADEAHFTVLSRLNHQRLVRDDSREQLFPKLVEIRDTFDSAFGPGSCQRILGIGTHIPRTPLEVRRLCDRVIQRLSAPDFELPPARSAGVALDPQQWVAELQPPTDVLRGALAAISVETRQADLTLEAKLEAIEASEKNFGRCSRMLEALYEVGERPHLAKRLRPPTRRSSSDAEGGSGEPGSPEESDDDPEEDDDSEESADDAPGEPADDASPDDP